MNTEELGFRSSLLKGDPLSMLGGLTHGGLSRMRDGGDQCRRGDAEAGNGINDFFSVTGEIFDRTGRATTSL